MSFYKILLTLTFIISTKSLLAIDESKLKVYDLQEFTKHNSKESCWVLMDKYIYDVTAFLDDHPGSYKILFKCCAKDCTKGYADKGIGEAHSNKSDKMRDKMIIGILKEKMESK